MVCSICKRRIKAKETRFSSIMRTRNGQCRKVYACETCEPQFSEYLDSCEIDAEGWPIFEK